MIIRWVAEVKVKLVCMRVDLALFVECVASEEEVIWSQWSERTAELSLHNSSAKRSVRNDHSPHPLGEVLPDKDASHHAVVQLVGRGRRLRLLRTRRRGEEDLACSTALIDGPGGHEIT